MYLKIQLSLKFWDCRVCHKRENEDEMEQQTELTGLISFTRQGEEWTQRVTAAMSLGFQNPCLLLAAGRFQADRKRYIFVKCFKCWMWSLTWQCPFESLRSSVLDVQRNTFQSSAFQILSEQKKKFLFEYAFCILCLRHRVLAAVPVILLSPLVVGHFFFFFFFCLPTTVSQKRKRGRGCISKTHLSSFLFLYSLPSPSKIHWIVLYVTSIKKKITAAPLKPSKSN